jgi:Putative Ig domain
VLAAHISIDFGAIPSDGDDFGTATLNDGSGACTDLTSTQAESCPLTLTGNASTGAIALGFPITFGSTTVSSVFINENGIVSFSSALSFPNPVTNSSFSSLSALGVPVIAPYFADLTSIAFQDTVFDMVNTPGQLMYQRGSAVPSPNGADLTGEVPAFMVTWDGPTETGGTPIYTQLIIYSHSSSATGDFDIRFRYGLQDTDKYNNGIAGLLLGSNTLNVPGPLDGTNDYFYSFRNGVLVGSTPPPPLTLACPAGTAQVGSAYSSALTAAGGVPPYTFSDTGSLPPGLALNATSGAVTGTPTAAGTFAFTAQVKDTSGTAAGTVSSSCTIVVAPVAPKLSVTPAALSFGTVKRYDLGLKAVTLTNKGTSPIALSHVSLTNGGGDLAALSLCPSTLAAGKSCAVYVLLVAFNVGSISATLNIPNNATGSPQAVPVSVTVNPR